MGCSTSQIAASTESAPKHLDKAQNKPNVVQDTKADSEAASASIRFAAVSEPGWTTSHAKINQDVVLAVPDLTEDISLFAVFDGHGQFGHQVAAFVAGALPKALLAQGPELLKSDTTTVIRQASRTVESALRRSGLKTAYSGTTATWAIVNHEEKTIFVANIGDSRAIVTKAVTSESKWEAIPLSNDHKPELASEKSRILAKGGRVATLPGPPGMDLGPLRVWLSHTDAPGLAMSRSFGDDVAHTVGVTSEPEILEYHFQDADRMLILATDGVWEFLSSEDVSQMVCESVSKYDLHTIAHNIAKKSHKLWRKYEPVVDDISLVIVDLSWLTAVRKSTATSSIEMEERPFLNQSSSLLDRSELL